MSRSGGTSVITVITNLSKYLSFPHPIRALYEPGTPIFPDPGHQDLTVSRKTLIVILRYLRIGPRFAGIGTYRAPKIKCLNIVSLADR